MIADDDHVDSLDALVAAEDRLNEALAASFVPVDLAPVVSGEVVQPSPSVLRRDDGQCLFYAGQINGIHGDSGVGKGWVALLAVAQQLRAGRNAMFVDVEDVPASIVARLRLLGATDSEIVDRLVYVRPVDAFGAVAVDRLLDLIAERHPSIVVLDSLGECFGLDGIDENHDAEVAPWLRRVARRLADAGPAILLVDHSTKAADNPLYPSGSKRKRAAIGGASYLLTASTALSSGTGGRLKITCAKDRHGTYARSEHVADLVMAVDALGPRVSLYTPDDRSTAANPTTLLIDRITDVITAHGQPCSISALGPLLREKNLRASNQSITATVNLMLERKQLVETPGPRKARMVDLAPAAASPQQTMETKP